MPAYRDTAGAVQKVYSKFDNFKIEAVGGEAKHQAQTGSGRKAIFGCAKDGMLIKTWTEHCAKNGFDTPYCINSLQKHEKSSKKAWGFSAVDSVTGDKYEDIKKMRTPKAKKSDVTPIKTKTKAKTSKPRAKKKAA